jgi:hypothetical protein
VPILELESGEKQRFAVVTEWQARIREAREEPRDAEARISAEPQALVQHSSLTREDLPGVGLQAGGLVARALYLGVQQSGIDGKSLPLGEGGGAEHQRMVMAGATTFALVPRRSPALNKRKAPFDRHPHARRWLCSF